MASSSGSRPGTFVSGLPRVSLTEPRRAALRECKRELLSLVGTRGRMAATSFAQQRLWLFDRLVPGTGVYNIPEAIRWQGPLDIEALRDSFAGGRRAPRDASYDLRRGRWLPGADHRACRDSRSACR